MSILKTPIYGIEFAGPGEKPKDYTIQQQALARSIEDALARALVPPTGNLDIRVAASAAARNAYFGAPATTAAQLALQARGPLCVRTDLGNQVETYLAARTAGNPQGNPAGAGWYSIGGAAAPDDTGWLLIGSAGQPAYATKYSAVTTATGGAAIRKKAGIVYLGGGMLASGGTAPGDVPFVLPVGWRPAFPHRGVAQSYSNVLSPVEIQPDGRVVLVTSQSASSLTVVTSFPV